MAFIKKSRINPVVKREMLSKAGYREKNLIKTSTHVYTSNNGRCIEFLNSKTGKRCQFDLISRSWTM